MSSVKNGRFDSLVLKFAVISLSTLFVRHENQAKMHIFFNGKKVVSASWAN